MRYLNISFLFIFIIFTGCAVQQGQIVEVDVTKEKKEDKRIEVRDDGVVVIKKEEKALPIESQKQQKETTSEKYEDKSFNIAVIYPSQVVGKYAIDGVNSITSYLLYKDVEFSLKTYDCMNEDQQSLEKMIKNIDLSSYKYIVLFMTENGLKKFIDIEGTQELNIYAPLVNKNEISFESKNIVFGGIDYAKQFEKLFELVDINNISEFHDSVSLGQNLSYKLDKLYDIKYKFQKRLIRNKINYESFLENNTRIKNSSVFLNTPIVQTSILLSQMRAHEIEYEKLLSTQINYTPLILSLTQIDDRKNLIIASSIGKIDETLIEYGAFLNTNFMYNWVNYSTLIGIDYLHSIKFDKKRIFENQILDNQVLFDMKLYEVGKYSFKPYVTKVKELKNDLNPISE